MKKQSLESVIEEENEDARYQGLASAPGAGANSLLKNLPVISAACRRDSQGLSKALDQGNNISEQDQVSVF